MAKKTEYLITRYNRDSTVNKVLRAPTSTNLSRLLERLICRDLSEEDIISSCLRPNAKRWFDPFQIIDLRDELRRDQAREAMKLDPNTKNPMGLYNNAWRTPIPLGTTLMIAGIHHEYFVKEVEAEPRPRKR